MENFLPGLYDEMKCAIRDELAGIDYFSFTTDAWSISLLSFTAHWLTNKFVRKSAVLHIQSQTSGNKVHRYAFRMDNCY